MDTRIAQIGGPVHFIDFGGTGSPMVLVHGLGGSAINWLGVGPALAQRGRVVALDLAGFGRTPLNGRAARVPEQRELLSRFLASEIGEPAIVVGNSMGGLIAMMEAAVEPAAISRLALVAPAQPRPPRGRIDPEVLMAFILYSLPWIGAWYLRRRAHRLGASGLVAEMLRICCADPSRVAPALRDAHVALTAERLERMPWDVTAFLDAARSTVKCVRSRRRFYDMAQKISAPAMLIQGARDRLVPLEASRELIRVRPDWGIEVLDDLGHVPQLEDPAGFVDVMHRWLDKAPPAHRSIG